MTSRNPPSEIAFQCKHDPLLLLLVPGFGSMNGTDLYAADNVTMEAEEDIAPFGDYNRSECPVIDAIDARK